jgi:hypothetical protein
MLIRKACTLAAATALLATFGFAGSATAAKAPADFYGVVPQSNLGASDFERMGTGKVGSVRSLMNWGAIDPSAAADDNNWSTFDPIVLDAARNGIEILPFVFATPSWVANDLDNRGCSASKCVLFAPTSPAALAAWQEFIKDAVERYGPNGTLWAENPGVPKTPIDTWQFWNEQNSESFFKPKPKPKAYAKLLAAADDAVASVDPSADVVLGGMAELAGSRKAIRGTEYLADLYDVKGAKKDFDGVAPHPYGATIGKVSGQVEAYRKVMKQAGDSGASLYVTEVGAGSKSGGNPLNRGKKGQASLLKQIYKYFQKKRNAFNVETVDWFSWQDISESICSWCSSSGLLTKTGQAKPSYKAFTKLTGGSTGKR